MNPWKTDYARQQAVSRDQHIANDWDSFAQDQEDSEYRIDLRKAARVYSDFFVPAGKADALFNELQNLGFEYQFIGAADECEPTFVHVRREAIWTADEFKELTPKLLDLCDKFDAAYDGSFMISVDEDEPDA